MLLQLLYQVQFMLASCHPRFLQDKCRLGIQPYRQVEHICQFRALLPVKHIQCPPFLPMPLQQCLLGHLPFPKAAQFLLACLQWQ
uniref:Polypyrimidine tract-binding protein homolog 1-like isoform X2 n=1 Tax=Rhizophora mucronata TaxID=61149 RepID=A0A2P2L6R0_RHIMU